MVKVTKNDAKQQILWENKCVNFVRKTVELLTHPQP